MTQNQRPLHVFLCHASGDKPVIREYYKRLVQAGFEVWLDEENLLPGQDWRYEIPRVVRNSDVVIVFVSSHSVTREGYVQKEIRLALDIAYEKPDGTSFIIPARLEDCPVPERLSRFHRADLFVGDGYQLLLKALQAKGNSLGDTQPGLALFLRRLIDLTLAHTGGNKTRVADMLGISLKTLHNKLNRLKAMGTPIEP